jgi:hypothetical protein
MHRRTSGLVAFTAVALIAVGVLATTALAASVGKPVLSGAPHMNHAFTVTGVTSPAAKSGAKAVVKLQLLMRMSNGNYGPMHSPYTAKLTKRSGGYKYSKSVSIPMLGKHAIQALRYDNGKLVGKSAIAYFEVTAASQSISIDGDSHADVGVAASTPIDVVFHYAAGRPCAASIHFLSPLFTKTSSDPLTFHADSLPAGSYPWECSMGPGCHGGTLIVSTGSQVVSIDGDSHADQTAPAGASVDVVFHYAAGRPCARSIHFISPLFTKTASDPLTFHADNLPPGKYSWECSMGPGCHGGTLVLQ